MDRTVQHHARGPANLPAGREPEVGELGALLFRVPSPVAGGSSRPAAGPSERAGRTQARGDLRPALRVPAPLLRALRPSRPAGSGCEVLRVEWGGTYHDPVFAASRAGGVSGSLRGGPECARVFSWPFQQSEGWKPGRARPRCQITEPESTVLSSVLVSIVWVC